MTQTFPFIRSILHFLSLSLIQSIFHSSLTLSTVIRRGLSQGMMRAGMMRAGRNDEGMVRNDEGDRSYRVLRVVLTSNSNSVFRVKIRVLACVKQGYLGCLDEKVVSGLSVDQRI